MPERLPDNRLSDFAAKLERLKEESSVNVSPAADQKQSGYGMAFVLAADLLGGLVGGAGIGWLIDRWLGSAPLGLIAFFFLGAAAGMWNVYRTVRGYDMSLGFKPPITAASEGETEMSAGSRSDKKGGDHRGQSTPSVRSAADHPDSHRQH